MDPAGLEVLWVLTPKSVVGCLAGSGVYRFEFSKRLPDLGRLQRASAVRPCAAHVSMCDMRWDLRRGAYLCSELFLRDLSES